MSLALREAWEDFYVLDGAENWACVEGYSCEWEAIAAALATRGVASFKRCRVGPEPGGMVLWSPRNRTGPNDDIHVPDAECDTLARHILSTLPQAPR